MSEPKYAPARDGLKPYVVSVYDWGRERDHLVWAEKASDARYEAVGRTRPGVYAGKIRRATPADLVDES